MVSDSGKKIFKFLEEMIFIFPRIFQAFRMALQPTKLIITFCCIAVLCIIGRILDLIWYWAGQFTPSEGQSPLIYQGVSSSMWSFAATKFHGAVESVFAFNLPVLVENITGYFQAIGMMFKIRPVYCTIFAVAALAVFSVGGGAICRIAALQVAKGEKPGLTMSLRFALKQFTSFFTAPLAPIVILSVLGIFIVFLGLLGNIPVVGELLVGLGLPLALVFGFLLTTVVVGTFAGFNLMFPAVAYDGSDCFDAISRSFCYVYDRPWWMLLYTSTAIVYGSFCYIFVRLFAFLALWLTRWTIGLGLWSKDASGQVNKLQTIWPEPSFLSFADPSAITTHGWNESLAAFIIWLFVLVVTGLVIAFVINFYFSANTVIYALLRYRVDNTPMEDIYTPADEKIALDETISSPPIQTQNQSDAQGKSE
jgi:hypothetical protein